MAKKPAAATDFGAYLKKIAADNGYNQATLARAAGVNQTQLSRAMENLTVPSIETMRKIVPLLNVRLGDMMIRAGLATAAELGIAGSAPPPLPSVVRDILDRLGPRSPLNEKEKRVLQRHLLRSLESFDEFYAERLADVATGRTRR